MDNSVDSLFDIPKPASLTQLAGGGNNRVFKLEFGSGKPLIYKQYFQHPNDPRPRLETEFSFLQHAWDLGIRNIPEPLQINRFANAALYSFLDGRTVESCDVDDSLIQEKVAFFLALNQKKQSGAHLRIASESCFSLEEYLKVVGGRISRLYDMPVGSSIEKEAADFFQNELTPKWKRIEEWVCKTALHSGLSLNSKIPPEERCISPSDFGFHNALILSDKRAAFIDFEYAGWDDACKTVCDLFCQPKVPIPESYFLPISQAFASVTANAEECLKRIEMIRPVMQIKWCCILLNTFTQVGKSRRLFSESEEVKNQEKQLHAAKQLLNQIANVWLT